MAFNNYYGQPNYGNYTYQPNYQSVMPQPLQQQPQMPIQNNNAPKTNKIFVTSLEEAMNKSVEPNSVIIYLHQDLPLLFEITTDFFGKRTYKTFDILESVQKPPTNSQEQEIVDMSSYVTKDKYKAVQERLERLESMLSGNKTQSKKTSKETEDKEN